jgi:tRNA pseudouridine38-40 synthase
MSTSDVCRFRATLAYDGTAYCGFQRQVPDQPSVQAAVERAISAVIGQDVGLIAAGRTDSGVHARGQVIAFDVGWKHSDADLLRAINANVPDDIAVQDIVQQAGFHPRFDATSRLYRYYIIQAMQHQPLLRHYTWRVRDTLDVQAMQTAAGLLIGEHDFATFGRPPQGTNTVRRVMVSAWTTQTEPYGAALVYHIEANAFLYRMVRRIVGMLTDVGRQRMTIAAFEEAFRRAELIDTVTVAPPQGLILEAVRYPTENKT